MSFIKLVGFGLVLTRPLSSSNKTNLDLLLYLNICYLRYIINVRQEQQRSKYWTWQHTMLYYSPTGARFI